MFFLQDCLKTFSLPSHELVSLGGNFHIKQAEEKAECSLAQHLLEDQVLQPAEFVTQSGYCGGL